MKTKILAYSKTDWNKVVSRYEMLEKVNDNVFTYLNEKSEYEQGRDILGVVVKVENVFFEESTYSRDFLSNHDVGTSGSEYALYFRQKVDDRMVGDYHMSLLIIEVYKQLGWDYESLISYREEREKRIKAIEQEKEMAKAKVAQEAVEKEKLRLESVKAGFINGEYIPTDDFIALCKQADVPIPLRTHGTLNESANELCIKGWISYNHRKGKRKPDFTGCHKLIRAYAEAIGIKSQEQ